MMSLIGLCFLGAASLVDVSALVATEVIRAGDTVTPANTAMTGAETPLSHAGLYGQEVRRTIYIGQEIRADNTRAPHLVERNQIVTVKYINGALEISATGRAMSAAAVNEPVTVLNLQSRQLVNGVVQPSGWVLAQ